MNCPQLTLKVEPSAPPQAPTKLDDEMKEKLKLVLSSRFNVQNKALDLSKFHADPAFLGESAYLPLNRYNVMLEVSFMYCFQICSLSLLKRCGMKHRSGSNLGVSLFRS